MYDGKAICLLDCSFYIFFKLLCSASLLEMITYASGNVRVDYSFHQKRIQFTHSSHFQKIQVRFDSTYRKTSNISDTLVAIKLLITQM